MAAASFAAGVSMREAPRQAAENQGRFDDVLTWLERAAALALTVAVVLLLLTRTQHAGALWRDECAAVQLAQMPTLSELFANFQRESFPALFPLTIRGFAAVFGSSDGGFRIFGFLVGLSMVGAFWLNACRLTNGPPLLGLALLGLNTTFLCWGTGMRGYGIGSAAIVLTFGLVARILIRPTTPGLVAMGAVALMAIHFLFYNTILFACMVLIALAISWRSGRSKTGLLVAAIAGFGALTMVPYLGPFGQESQSTIVLQIPMTVDWFATQLDLALGLPLHWTALLWGSLWLGLTALALGRFRAIGRDRAAPEASLLSFAVLVPVLAVPAYFAFLKIVNYRTREWYYLALISILAASLDLLAATLCRSDWMRMVRLAAVVVALAVLPAASWGQISLRQTNVDLVARQLEERAQPNDLVVVNPWMLGVSFNRYYHGSAKWVTNPLMDDHRLHRYDLLKANMMSPDAFAGLQAMMTETLRANHRIWIVGRTYLPEPGGHLEPLPPAPHSKYGWDGDTYAVFWSAQLGDFMVKHVSSGGFVPVGDDEGVNPLERERLFMVEGWRD